MKSFVRFGITLVFASLTCAQADLIAVYDFEAGGSGNTLNSQPGLFSTDTEPNSIATELTSTGLDGGGANNIFNGGQSGSMTGPPLSNWGNGELTEANANFAAFTTTPSPGYEITYESLSLYHGAFNLTPMFKITYAIGAGPDVPAVGPTGHTADNSNPVTLLSEDFTDFTTSETVTWKIHVFGADAANTGSRFDDITINGTVSLIPEPSSAVLFGLASMVLIGRLRRR